MSKPHFVIKYPELNNKITYFLDGTPLIRTDISEDEFNKFLEIKENLSYQSKFEKLHHCVYGIIKQYIFKPNHIHIYYIPSDIFDYIEYNGNEIVANNLPKSLEKKFSICKIVLDIDLNYLYKYRNAIFIGKKINGLTNEFITPNRPIIFIKRSQKGKIGRNQKYVEIIENNYIKYYVHGYISKDIKISIGNGWMI